MRRTISSTSRSLRLVRLLLMHLRDLSSQLALIDRQLNQQGRASSQTRLHAWLVKLPEPSRRTNIQHPNLAPVNLYLEQRQARRANGSIFWAIYQLADKKQRLIQCELIKTNRTSIVPIKKQSRAALGRHNSAAWLRQVVAFAMWLLTESTRLWLRLELELAQGRCSRGHRKHPKDKNQ